MATLKDIARRLDLSPATVSRALNGFPEVAQATRARVSAAAEEMGYRPNRTARQLVTGRSGMAAMILQVAPDIGGDPGLLQMATGLSHHLAAAGLDMVFAVDQGGDPVAPYARMLARRMVDGFILAAPLEHDARIRHLDRAGAAFVVHGRSDDRIETAFYDVDNGAAIRDAVGLLADLGHRRLALVNGPDGLAYARQRARAFRRALAHHGLDAAAARVSHGPTDAASGYLRALAALGGRDGPPPTAFVCASVPVAEGVCRALADRGLRVPADASVIAHDDATPGPQAAEIAPGLTVTRAPLLDACRPLAEMLAARIAGTPPRALQVVRRAELIPRGSTGPAPADPPAG